MKSFFKNVVQRKEGPGLVGKTMKVGSYMVRIESLLGEGGFASIYRVRDSNTNKSYALKHMRLAGEKEALSDCHTEVDAMKLLAGQPNILPLKAVAFSGPRGAEQEAYLLLDLCQENLVEFMNGKSGPISDKTVMHVFLCACRAVAAMHLSEPPMAHRDLKAENLLLDSSNQWVLCDFGSVTTTFPLYESANQIMMGEEVMRRYTTPSYRAPEMWDLYSRERIDVKADIWALGCLFYYLLFNKLAFGPEAKLHILNGDYTVSGNRPPAFVALLRQLLVTNPAKRPDITVLLERVEILAAGAGVDTMAAPESSAPSEASLQATPPAAAGQAGNGASGNSFTSASSWHSSPAPDMAGRQARAAATAPAPSDSPHATFISLGTSAAVPPRGPDRSAGQAGSTSGDYAHLGLPQSQPDTGDVQLLRQQLAEARAQVQTLAGALRTAQGLVKQLQVENANQAAQLRKLATQGSTPTGAAAGGWVASFDDAGPGASPHHTSSAASLDGLTQPANASAPSSRHSSPLRTTSPTRAPTSSQFAPQQANNDQFDPFGIGDAPKAAQDEPADNGALDLKFDAFEDEFEEDATTPLASTSKSPNPNKLVQVPSMSAKVRLKSLHRRTSSEPTPVDSWHLASNAEWSAG